MVTLRTVLIHLMLVLSLTAQISSAKANNTGIKEALIIRFNEPAVEYQNSLKKLVAEALRVKPKVFFDIVYLSPKNDSTSESLVNNVVSQIKYYGVASDRIRITNNTYEGKTTEIHIFLR